MARRKKRPDFTTEYSAGPVTPPAAASSKPTTVAQLLDALCGDDDSQPYPVEALWTLEGLQYLELQKLWRKHDKGAALTPWQDLNKAVTRRELATALGVTDPAENAELARQAGSALDRVATTAKRIGVTLSTGQGSRAELLQVTTALASSGSWEGTIGSAVVVAQELIREVDLAMAPRVSLAGPDAGEDGDAAGPESPDEPTGLEPLLRLTDDEPSVEDWA